VFDDNVAADLIIVYYCFNSQRNNRIFIVIFWMRFLFL